MLRRQYILVGGTARLNITISKETLRLIRHVQAHVRFNASEICDNALLSAVRQHCQDIDKKHPRSRIFYEVGE